jgi:anti-sigma B factor antagonist
MTKSLTVAAMQHGRATVISISGEIDMATVPQLREALEEALRQSPPCLVLDLTDLDFCDSSGLALLVAVRRRLAPEASLLLAAAKPIVARVFQVTGLTEVFPFFPTVAEAVAAADGLAPA